MPSLSSWRRTTKPSNGDLWHSSRLQLCGVDSLVGVSRKRHTNFKIITLDHMKKMKNNEQHLEEQASNWTHIWNRPHPGDAAGTLHTPWQPAKHHPHPAIATVAPAAQHYATNFTSHHQTAYTSSSSQSREGGRRRWLAIRALFGPSQHLVGLFSRLVAHHPRHSPHPSIMVTNFGGPPPKANRRNQTNQHHRHCLANCCVSNSTGPSTLDPRLGSSCIVRRAPRQGWHCLARSPVS